MQIIISKMSVHSNEIMHNVSVLAGRRSFHAITSIRMKILIFHDKN